MSDGHEDTAPGLIISMCAVVFNALLNPLFIWTFGLGFTGSAWATLVTRICMALAIWFYLRSDKNIVSGDMPSPLKTGYLPPLSQRVE